MQVAVAEQLKRRGIDAVTVRDLGTRGEDDEEQLARATAMGYVLCTCDSDFIEIASSGVEHCGIVFGQQKRDGIGEWVKALVAIHSRSTPDDMKNNVEYL
jgi:hypothetical protein